jgi:hypothetical protein
MSATKSIRSSDRTPNKPGFAFRRKKLAPDAGLSHPMSDSPNEQRSLTYMSQDVLDHGEVERLAYLFWLERGSPMGSPDEDWFRAEEELLPRDSVVGPPFSSFAMGPIEEQERSMPYARA